MSKDSDRPGLTYRAAGVDIEAGEQAVERIKAHVRSTARPEVISEIGGFGGLFAARFADFDDPVLVSSTDGVGTKSKIAQLTGRLDTIGIDLVAGCVDDIAVQGAEPLFFLDYVSVGKLDPDAMEAIVAGVAAGCRDAGCALLGGEMSEHPGLMEPGEFDLVGFAVGVVERARILPHGVSAADAVVGIASPGLQLMLPSVVYARAMVDLRTEVDVHAYAHVTGGGIPDNLARVLPADLDAHVRRGSWPEPRIFAEVQAAGDIADAEMERVFNLGVGMLAIVPSDDAEPTIAALRASGHDAFLIGELVGGRGEVVLTRAR
jgi:phosphoribosylformylglycinamidine cyclo-ligase